MALSTLDSKVQLTPAAKSKAFQQSYLPSFEKDSYSIA